MSGKIELLATGRAFGFLVLLVTIIAIVYFIRRTRQTGKVPHLRTIAAVKAIDECVGRSAEMNRPVHFTEGHAMAGKLYDTYTGPTYLAGLSVLGRVARLCATKGARLLCSIGHAELLPLVTETVRSGYLLEGKREDFDERNIRYFPEQSYTLGTVAVIEQERAGANLLLGSFYGQDSVMSPMAGAEVGAMQIGGAAAVGTIPFLIAGCDYVLIGEELFVAGAVTSGDPAQTSSIAAQDISKVIGLVVAVLGVLMAIAGVKLITDLLNV